jgi:hypothetical protein
MVFSTTTFGITILASFFMLSVVPPCNCKRFECLENPRSETPGIYFKLKDRITGNDILTAGTAPLPVPDSIKLKDLSTGYSYPLHIGLGVNESNVYTLQYRQPANIVDSLIFLFGNATPDTLIIYTGIVKGWRGDECPFVNDAGITKVMLRGQVLLETMYDSEFFTLKK